MKKHNFILLLIIMPILLLYCLHCQLNPGELLGGGEGGTLHVISTMPSDGQTNVTINTDIRVAFDAHIDDTTLSYRTFFVGNAELGDINGVLSLQRSTDTVIFTPSNALQPGKEYLVTVTTGLKGSQGEKLEKDYKFRFTTASASAPSNPTNPQNPSEPPSGSTYVYVSTSGNLSNTGLSPDSPLPSITAGIAKAQEKGYDRVLVSQGTYNEQVTMVEGISLYGGYSASNWNARDPGLYVTTIRDPSTSGGPEEANPNYAVKAGSGITRATVVDGFTIQGGGGTFTTGVFCTSGASPTIQNNVISGGSGTNTRGVSALNSAPLIQRNTISGGNAGQWGIAVSSSTSSCIIQYNYIEGGTAGRYSWGVNTAGLADPPPLIQYNHIDGGFGADQDSYGVQVRWPGNGIFLNNTIYGGRSTWSHGFRIQDNASTAIIRNNTIDGGSGSSSRCIRLQGETTGSGPTVTIENNILMSSKSGIGINIWSGTPVITQGNNAFAGCGSGTNTTNGNIMYASVANLFLVDYAGGDWHLTSSTPAEVRQGGKDGSVAGWGFNTDKDGNIRTGNGSTGWSRGAYEKD